MAYPTRTNEDINNDIFTGIKIINEAHSRNGKIWNSPKLFRLPNTDTGVGIKKEQIEQMLRQHGFQQHKDMQKSLLGGNSTPLSGLFLEDGNYSESHGHPRPTSDLKQHVRDQFNMFNNQFPIFFKKPVLGSHSTEHEVTYIQMLVNRGVKFIDCRKTF